MLTIEIILDPIVKKNNRPIYMRNGIPFIGKSQRLKDAESQTIKELENFKYTYEKLGFSFPLKGELEEDIWFYRKTRIKADTTNLIELANDCLQKVGIIENDFQFVDVSAHRRYDKENPRTLIYIHHADDLYHELQEIYVERTI